MFCANCGVSNSDSARFCAKCGTALGGAAPLVAGAAAAAPGAPAGGLRREGDRLVVYNGATLPPYCVKCGERSTNTVRKTFGWHQPWLYLLIIFPGVLIYAIVATIVMKKQKLAVPLCDAHRQRRRVFLGIGWVLLIGCIPLGVFIGNLGEDSGGWGVLAFFLAFIASLVFFVMGTRLMVPKKIDDACGIYGAVSPAFLQYVGAQAPAAPASR